jgi:hypothetical protein
MSASGQTRPSQAGQSLSALPLISDVDLLGNCECVIHLDAKIANRALDLAVLYGAQIARSTVDQRRLGSAQRMSSEEMRV